MRRLIGRFIFWLMGWKCVGQRPDMRENFVVLSTPHTSNKDYFVGLMAFWATGARVRILIKKESFKGLAGALLRAAGGIPVDRKAGNSGLILQLKKLLRNQKGIGICITPEGTRKRGGNWKTGFYYIALETGLPIWCGYMNYPKKELSYGLKFYPTGNVEEDFRTIRAWYESVPAVGRIPENGHQELWPKGQGLDAPRATALQAPAKD